MSFIFSLFGSIFPVQSSIQTILFRIDALFAITAFSCLASKATSENHDLPAAGFTVLAIAQGLFLAEINQAEKWDYATESVAVLFMIPSLIMIAYYTLFPKWLRILGVLSVIPFLIVLFVRHFSPEINTDVYEVIVFLLYQVVTLCWALQIWKKRSS